MKGIKKLVISLLALVMVMGASITAFAAGGTITIENALAGQTYDAYRVFDYVPADADNAKAGGVYKLNADFASKGFADYTYKYKDENGKEISVAMSSFFTVGDGDVLDTTGLGTKEKPGDVATFGKAALAFAKANGIAAKGSKTAGGEGVEAGKEVKATIDVDDFGYYVVDSSLGTAVAVDTTTPDVTIKEKNGKPGLNKTITGATNESTIAQDLTGNDAQIGDEVEFTISADFKVGGEKYVIVDVMDPGLTLTTALDKLDVKFSDGVSMKYTTSAFSKVVDEKTNATREGFKIEFEGEPSKNCTVTVTYKAVVNTNAKISPDENINEAYLIYGHEVETTHIKTKTKTYPMILKKVIKGTDTVLAGAYFTIYRENDKSVVKFRKVSDTHYVVDPAGEVTDIVTVEKDPVKLEGFNLENYVLVETQAPEGYNLLVNDGDEFEYIDDNKQTVKTSHYQVATITANTTAEDIYLETVENSTGLTLPSTGGIGTTIFYIVGGLLIVAGVAYFIVRRKAAAK
jgi:LPXTG-motif cell wall-anchored protein